MLKKGNLLKKYDASVERKNENFWRLKDSYKKECTESKYFQLFWPSTK